MMFSNYKSGGLYKSLRAFSLLLICMFFTATFTPQVASQDGATQVIPVRSGQHAGFSRVVFDFTGPITYDLVQNDLSLVITLPQAVNFAWGGLAATPLAEVSAPQSSTNGGQTTITLQLAANSSSRHFMSGNSLVVDILAGQPPAQVVADVVGTTSSHNDEQENASASTTEDSGAVGQTPTAVLQPAIVAPRQQSQATQTEGALVVSVASITDGINLTYPWLDDVKLAAFERGGYLWVAFDRSLDVDNTAIARLAGEQAARIAVPEIMDSENSLVMRYAVRENQSVRVSKAGNSWSVSLIDTLAKPRRPLDPIREMVGNVGGRISVPVSDAGPVIELEDPVVGDTIFIVTLPEESTGLAQKFQYAEASLLETAQGIAVVPVIDTLIIERFTGGLSISSREGMSLSRSALGQAMLGGAFVDEVSEDPPQAQEVTAPARLIDINAWKLGPNYEYKRHEAQLLANISAADPEERNPARWDLARFYVAHERAAESLGYLGLMLEENPTLESNPSYRAVRGIASHKMRRNREALADLMIRELDLEDYAGLWRSVVFEELGQYDETLKHFWDGRDVLGSYEPKLRADFQLAAVRAALELQDIDNAQQELDFLSGQELTAKQISEVSFQRARLAELRGNEDEALTIYDDLITAPERWLATRARYARVKADLKLGNITPENAIESLERLRYAWRGGEFELQLLEDLGTLYFAQENYEKGLSSLWIGVAYFSDTLKAKQMRGQMSQVFKELYLEGVADKLSPITAIGLFYKFRLLTPSGAEGDLMIRNLSRRLVALELLEKAAELLNYQVRVRYKDQPIAQAQVATRLAKIFIMDAKYDHAIEIIRSTRFGDLPADIENARNHVEARALILLEKYEEAEILLERDRSEIADRLRSDVYFGGRDWPRLVTVNENLLSADPSTLNNLDGPDRLLLIRTAVAMNFLEDNQGLTTLRRQYGALMRTGQFANSFDLLTTQADLSISEIGDVVAEIASIARLQSFITDYQDDFQGEAS